MNVMLELLETLVYLGVTSLIGAAAIPAIVHGVRKVSAEPSYWKRAWWVAATTFGGALGWVFCARFDFVERLFREITT
jgi:hypothetical protein